MEEEQAFFYARSKRCSKSLADSVFRRFCRVPLEISFSYARAVPRSVGFDVIASGIKFWRGERVGVEDEPNESRTSVVEERTVSQVGVKIFNLSNIRG